MIVSVIDYGMGNVQSVVNACIRAGAAPSIACSGEDLMSQHPQRIVLPGVGAIGAALRNLRERDFESILNHLVKDGDVPFLGICVGMQVLGERCEEFGKHTGFGWIPGRVRKLTATDSSIRLPHMGWNTLELESPEDPILAGLEDRDVYFVHSYVLDCANEFVTARTNYGEQFVAAVRRENIAGVQFHPEKSSSVGTNLLRAFLTS